MQNKAQGPSGQESPFAQNSQPTKTQNRFPENPRPDDCRDWVHSPFPKPPTCMKKNSGQENLAVLNPNNVPQRSHEKQHTGPQIPQPHSRFSLKSETERSRPQTASSDSNLMEASLFRMFDAMEPSRTPTRTFDAMESSRKLPERSIPWNLLELLPEHSMPWNLLEPLPEHSMP